MALNCTFQYDLIKNSSTLSDFTFNHKCTIVESHSVRKFIKHLNFLLWVFNSKLFSTHSHRARCDPSANQPWFWFYWCVTDSINMTKPTLFKGKKGSHFGWTAANWNFHFLQSVLLKCSTLNDLLHYSKLICVTFQISTNSKSFYWFIVSILWFQSTK